MAVEVLEGDFDPDRLDVMVLGRSEKSRDRVYGLYVNLYGAYSVFRESVQSATYNWAPVSGPVKYVDSFDLFVFADNYSDITKRRVMRKFGAPGCQSIDATEFK